MPVRRWGLVGGGGGRDRKPKEGRPKGRRSHRYFMVRDVGCGGHEERWTVSSPQEGKRELWISRILLH